jgi:hypothetical protein
MDETKLTPAPVAPETPRERAEKAGIIPPAGKTKRDVAKDYSKVKFVRGQTLALAGKPVLIIRVGGDGSTNDKSTVHCGEIKPDGMIGHEHWIADWELRKRLDAGTATFIDGARPRTVVELPPEWAAQVAKRAEAVAAAKAARIESGDDPLDSVTPVSHPSYGVVTLTRASGYGYLFGSAFKHYSRLSLTVHRATLHRALSNDRPHPGEVLCKIDMSEAQFAHFVTSAAVGEGTPCTIRNVLGASMPETPPPEETEKFHADARRTMRNAARHIVEAIADARALLDKPGNVTKREREALVEHLRRVERAFDDSLPFTVEQFGERMEKIVAAGKQEIDSYLTRTAARAGLDAAPVSLALTGGEPSPMRDRTTCWPGCDLIDPHTTCIAHNGAALGPRRKETI